MRHSWFTKFIAWFDKLTLVSLLVSLVAGGVSGYATAQVVKSSSRTSLTELPATSTVPAVQIVPLTPRQALPSYPTAFIDRYVSPVLTLVKSGTGKVDAYVSPERVIGAAVSLTNDGWLAVPSVAIVGLRMSDMSVVWQGATYPVIKGVRDTATGVALLKINASGLPTTSLMRAADATPGMVAWEEPGSEPGSQIIFPTMLVNISSRASTMNQVANQVPSEQVMRRFLISGRLETKGGGAVWNDAGELVGLLESEEGSQTVSVIPASDVASTLHEFLSNRRITHATLNLKTTDLAHVTIDNVKRALPLSGNLVVQTAAVSSTLQLNDVIERIERDPLDGTVDLGERLLDYRPGATITISGLRKEKSFQTTVTLGSVVTGEGMK